MRAALLSYIDNKPNEIGTKYLRERLASDWAGAYAFATGSDWVNTGQHCIAVAIPRDASIDGLAATKRALLEIVPFVHPGAAGSAGKPFLADVKIFAIRDNSLSENGSRYLGLKGAEWRIIEQRRYSDTPWFVGTLDQCLHYIQQNLSYDV